MSEGLLSLILADQPQTSLPVKSEAIIRYEDTLRQPSGRWRFALKPITVYKKRRRDSLASISIIPWYMIRELDVKFNPSPSIC